MTETSKDPSRSETKIPDEVRKHFQAARRELRAGIQAMLPPDVLQHGRRARREMLLAWRSAIDAALDRLADQDGARR